jgi:L-lactate dehydrogenase (cytochrome)
MNMRLIGAPTLADVVPNMVDARGLYVPGPEQTMFDANCKSISNLSGVRADEVDERMLPVGVKANL